MIGLYCMPILNKIQRKVFKVEVILSDNSTRIYTIDDITKLLSIEHNQTRKDTISNDPGLTKIANGECTVFINDIVVSRDSKDHQLITQWFGSIVVDPTTG